MGKYKWPVKGIISKRGFGNRIHPISGRMEFHNGQDISCPVGTPVYCPEDGMCVLSDRIDDSKGGLQLRIKHTIGDLKNYTTGYAHLSKVLVNEREFCLKGDIIAYTGNTGGSTGAHLHFKVENPFGENIDPKLKFE